MSDFGFGSTFDPLADALPGAEEPIDLRGFLLEAGVSPAEIEQAGNAGTLELLALEKIVAVDEPRYELDEVAALSGVAAERIRAYWRALGFPDPRPGEKLFSDSDLEMLSNVVFFITDGALEPGVALQMARVMGSSLERIASAQVDTIETRRASPLDAADLDGEGAPDEVPSDDLPAGDPSVGDPSPPGPRVGGPAAADGPDLDRFDPMGPAGFGDDGGDVLDAAALARMDGEQLAIRRGAELLPMMPKVMEFVWRRHLHDAARRRRLRASAGEGHGVCVGFADLVGFTAQTQQLDEEQLADVVGRFETIAYDVVSSHGGRVVKMIGDEVMFTTDSVRTGAELALALAETYRNDEAMSDVRVGLASGPVLEREGDLYGPVVNLASRIVSIAYPGAVVVSEDIHQILETDDDFAFKTIRQHFLKDIGRVHLWTMRHADDPEDEPYRRARDRRAARREFMLGRRARRLAASHDLPVDVEDEVVELLEDAGLLDTGFEEHRYTGDEPTAEFEAISDAVLEADIDEDLQVELLADIEAARRLTELEREAQLKAEEADIEAEGRLELIEEETRRKIARIETEARRRVEETLDEAEARASKVNQEASRKVKRVADDAERKADQAEKEARRIARRKAAKRKAEKQKQKKLKQEEQARAEREAEQRARDEAARPDQPPPE